MSLQDPPITTVLVPQGAEYGAVCRGLRRLPPPARLPQVVPIPMGGAAVLAHLSQLTLAPGACLLMGLGGSLSPGLRVGDVVIGQGCLAVAHGVVVDADQGQERPGLRPCSHLSAWLQARLAPSASVGTVVTCDRILSTGPAKAAIHQLTQADVVDMESSAVLAALAPQPVAILRVISDDYDQTLPDLTLALGADGQLHPWPLAQSFLKQPRAATHLIRGSLRGLKQLQTVTTQIFSPLPAHPAR